MLPKLTLLLSSIFAFGAMSAPAGAEQLYRWESADGTVSFSDDAKRVPERYRDAAEQIDPNALSGYGRYTPTDRAATEAYTARLNERLESLRAMNDDTVGTVEGVARGERVVAPARSVPQPQRLERRSVMRRVDGSIERRRFYTNESPEYTSTPSLPVDPNDPHPVVTEQKRVRVPGQVITQTITVTRQGDRVLSVIVPQSAVYSTEFFKELSDYENN